MRVTLIVISHSSELPRAYTFWILSYADLFSTSIIVVLLNFLCLNSDGAGRSGVYLAIDANIELSEEDGVFDVYGYLVKMRQQRRGLVETLVSMLICLKILIFIKQLF